MAGQKLGLLQPSATRSFWRIAVQCARWEVAFPPRSVLPEPGFSKLPQVGTMLAFVLTQRSLREIHFGFAYLGRRCDERYQ
jgi:hypothetical protein